MALSFPGQQSSFTGYAQALQNTAQHHQTLAATAALHSLQQNNWAMLRDQPVPVPEPLPVSTKFGEIIGYRVWKLVLGHLKSTYLDYFWMPGKVAGLLPEQKIEDHGPAGIHCFKDQQHLMGMAQGLMMEGPTDLVFGTIRMWGDVIEYERGYHAEFASIVSLDELVSSDNSKRYISLRKLRERYHVAGKE